MRRFAIIFVMLFVMLVFGGSQQRLAAQEVNPEPVMPVLTGNMGFVTYANFGTVEAATLLDVPVGMNIYQLQLAPGSSVAYPPGDPGMGAHLVESETLTLRGFSVDVMLTRAPTQTSPDSTPTEVLRAGAETTLGPGDGFLFPPLAAGEVRNDGTEPVVLAVSVLFPMDYLPAIDMATLLS